MNWRGIQCRNNGHQAREIVMIRAFLNNQHRLARTTVGGGKYISNLNPMFQHHNPFLDIPRHQNRLGSPSSQLPH